MTDHGKVIANFYDASLRRWRQAWDRSLDGGKTWLPGYDFVYVRKA